MGNGVMVSSRDKVQGFVYIGLVISVITALITGLMLVASSKGIHTAAAFFSLVFLIFHLSLNTGTIRHSVRSLFGFRKRTKF
jgi:hypothetical protein